jgi:hypothetical protein
MATNNPMNALLGTIVSVNGQPVFIPLACNTSTVPTQQQQHHVATTAPALPAAANIAPSPLIYATAEVNRRYI